MSMHHLDLSYLCQHCSKEHYARVCSCLCKLLKSFIGVVYVGRAFVSVVYVEGGCIDQGMKYCVELY
jgi:hypothetical protein